MITAKSATKTMQVLGSSWERHVEEYCERVRREVIIPACQKYGVYFMSGNGSFSFYVKRDEVELSFRDSDTINSIDDCVGKYRGLRTVFKILQTELPPSDWQLGMFVGDAGK